MSDDVETLQNDKHQIQGSLGICEVEKVAAQSKNQDLLEKLEAAEMSKQKWMESSQEASSEISNLQQALQNAKSQCEELQGTCTLDQIVKERDDLINKLKELSSEKVKEKEGLERELERVENELSVAKSNAGDRAMQIQNLEDELCGAIGNLENQIQPLRLELSEQKSRREQELSDAQRVFEDSVREKEDKNKQLQAEIEDKLSIIQDLSGERDELSAQINAVCDGARSKETEIVGTYKDEVESLKKQLEMATEGAAVATTQLKTDAKEAICELLEELKNALTENRSLALAAAEVRPSMDDDPLPEKASGSEKYESNESFQMSFHDMIGRSDEVLQNALCEFNSECSSDWGDDEDRCISGDGPLLKTAPMVEYSVYESLRRKCDTLQDEREELLNEAFALMDSSAAAHAAEIEALSKRVENETEMRLMERLIGRGQQL